MEAIIVRRQPSVINRPVVIVLTVLAIVALWCVNPFSYQIAVLLGVVALFVLGLRNPIWAMAAFLVSQLTITSYMIATPFGVDISLRLILLIFTAIIMWRSLVLKEIELGPGAKRVVIPTIVLLIVTVAANFVNTDIGYVFRDFRSMLVGVLLIILLPSVTKNMKDLRTLCTVAFIVAAASAIIGIMQYHNFLGVGDQTLVPVYVGRVPGMAENALDLSFVLPVVVLAVLSIYLAKGVQSSSRGMLFISLIPIALALYYTFTRSALLGLVFGLVALFLFFRTRIKGEFILAAMLLAVVLIEVTGVWANSYLMGRGESEQDESAMSREILWQVGIAIAIDNPILGIGGDQFKAVSPGYTSSVDPELLAWESDNYFDYTIIGQEEQHNDYLRMWISYGVLGLIAYLWLHIVIIRNYLDSFRISKNRFVKGLAIGLSAGLVAYMANAFYHNCTAVMPLLWILAAFSIATVKMAAKEKNTKQSRQAVPQV
jgi:O-antigen ligase